MTPFPRPSCLSPAPVLHLAWRGHPPALLLAVCWPCLQANFPLTLVRASPVTPASLLLSPQLSSNLQLLTAHGSWHFFIPLSTCSPLCLSLSSSVDITNRNIMLSFPSFPSAGSSSVLSIFVLAGLPTCIEIFRNFSSSLAQVCLSPRGSSCCPFLQSSAGFSKKTSELCCDLPSLLFDPLFHLDKPNFD